MTKYLFKLNGVDFSNYVDAKGYKTTVTPVFSNTITTLDGVGHTALVRYKGSLSISLNALKASDVKNIAMALMNAPVEVAYHCIQRNADVIARMVPDAVTARFLPYCIYGNQDWNVVDEITLVEL